MRRVPVTLDDVIKGVTPEKSHVNTNRSLGQEEGNVRYDAQRPFTANKQLLYIVPGVILQKCPDYYLYLTKYKRGGGQKSV